MTDTPPTGPAASLDVREGRRPLWQRLSLVWLVPLAALALALGTAFQNYSDRGVLITIAFDDAFGVQPGETPVKFRDVTVGEVERLEFAAGLNEVLLHVRIDKSIAPYLDDDAMFWIVRPEVSVRGITGLDTVLSGVYVEGTWDAEADVAQTEFVGSEQAVLTTSSSRGTVLTLRANDASAISAGAPVLHKGIEVGYLETPILSEDGTQVLVNAFIEAPYDRRITTSTRFWDTSGFSVTLGAAGVSLDVNSIASLIEGGISFDTLVSGGSPIGADTRFEIYDSREAARESLFTDPNADLLKVAVWFEESVSGLAAGSEVRFQGIRVGQVDDISAIVVGEGRDADVRLQAVLSIDPSRLGMGQNATPEDALRLLSDFVTRGLRARMVTGNILSGSLVVQLIELEDALPAIMNLTSGAYPVIPTTEAEISDVAATAEDLLARINALPVEELMEGAIDLMDSLERLANDENTVAAPERLVGLLDSINTLFDNDDARALPPDLREAVNQIAALFTDANEAEIVSDLDVAINAVTAATENINAASESLPRITEDIAALTGRLGDMDFESVVTNANDTLDAIEALVSNPDAQALPAALKGAADELTAILSEASEADLVGGLDIAIESAAAAAKNVELAAEGLPEITAQIERFVERANELELQSLVDNANETLASIEAFMDQDSTRAVPENLNGALDELRAILGELREGGAVENVNAALAAARQAAQAIEAAVADFPALSAQARRTVVRIEEVFDGYDTRSRFGSETMTTLRDIQEAADAVSALARQIQRNPNSLLTGR